MTYKKISKHTFIILIFALSMVILAVFRCSFLIRDTLTLEVQKNLKDVTAQNALTVTQELTDKFNLLNSLSSGITDVSNDSEEYIQYLKAYTDTYHFKRIGTRHYNYYRRIQAGLVFPGFLSGRHERNIRNNQQYNRCCRRCP